jgi:rare lipoprotein A (peptidoglycan hydrolase)
MKKTTFFLLGALMVFLLVSCAPRQKETPPSRRMDGKPETVQPVQPKKIMGKVVGEKIYLVKRGDSVFRVAAKQKLNVSDLCRWNGLSRWQPLRPGQKLVIKKIKWPEHRGVASWYGPGFHGKKRADGRTYNMDKVSVAHRDLPLGTKIKATNLKNRKSILALWAALFVKTNRAFSLAGRDFCGKF